MTRLTDALYTGTVVHRRLRPRDHKLRYSVFSCLFDCDHLDKLDRRLRLFSRNRFNLFSLYDKDHTGGTPLPDYLRGIADESGHGAMVDRFMMLCFPRVLGYAFNPLTVYFGLDADDRIRLVIYEVRNTFGQRQSYVLPADADDTGLIVQRCRKRLYVSPFNAVDGSYRFHVTSLDQSLTIGINLKTDAGPLLTAYYRAERALLTDRNLLKAFVSTGWMTVKVAAGIRYEALKLWLKGLRVVPRPTAAPDPFIFINTAKEDPS